MSTIVDSKRKLAGLPVQSTSTSTTAGGASSPEGSSLEVPVAQQWQRPSMNETTSAGPHGSGGDGTGGLYSTRDPRASSTQSLVPSLPEYEEFAKRKLLIVYIHGFMGNDTSFQSFPLHVHRYLKEALAETHVIHSKIYPRYKTYKAIEVARDNFSNWLQPHESPSTDVVLVGHSMGGVLAADVVLMPGQRPQQTYLKHRIIGAVHLDSPILGLHPGIVISGISSLFRSKPEKPGSPTGPGAQLGANASTSDVLSQTQSIYSENSFDSQSTTASSIPSAGPGLIGRRTMDPNFDPSFANDVRLKDRGWWKNVVHFAQKHSSEGLLDAATKHMVSHLEFGSCLMDYSGLKNRYENVRKLEDIDDIKNYGFPHIPPQVRFVQYYTVCHGFPKVPKSPKGEDARPAMPQSLDSVAVGSTMTVNAAGEPDATKWSVEDADIASRQSIGKGESGKLTTAALDAHTKRAGSPAHRSVSDWSGSGLQMLEPEPMPSDDEALKSGSRAGDMKQQHEAEIEDAENKETADDAQSEASSVIEKPDETVSKQDELTTMSCTPPRIVKESATGTLPDLTTAASTLSLDLPSIPETPTPPELPDLTMYADKDARKMAEKESKRLLKVYEQAVKDRNKAIKERDKIIEKRQKKLAHEAEKREKDAQKQAKLAEKQKQKMETEDAKKQAEAKAVAEAESVAQSAAAAASTPTGGQLSPQTSDVTGAQVVDHSQEVLEQQQPSSPEPHHARSPPPDQDKPPKKLKERKFINMPSKINGQADPKWVKIFMKDMDETAAHTSLFFPGDHYEKLVGDVGELVVQWVQFDLTKKAIMGWSEG